MFKKAKPLLLPLFERKSEYRVWYSHRERYRHIKLKLMNKSNTRGLFAREPLKQQSFNANPSTD